MSKKDGGPAYPSFRAKRHFEEVRPGSGEGKEITSYMPKDGMSLRDWFAGLAMQGLMANPETYEHAHNINQSTYREIHQMVSRDAYDVSDAMLKEREK